MMRASLTTNLLAGQEKKDGGVGHAGSAVQWHEHLTACVTGNEQSTNAVTIDQQFQKCQGLV